MKKFIVVIVMCVVFSGISRAQYIYGPRVSDDVIVENLNDIVEQANEQIRRGTDYIWLGLISQAFGAVSMQVPAFAVKNGMENFEDTSKAFYIGGAVLVVGGAILESIGICKRWEGITDKKTVRISATTAGFVINF